MRASVRLCVLTVATATCLSGVVAPASADPAPAAAPAAAPVVVPGGIDIVQSVISSVIASIILTVLVNSARGLSSDASLPAMDAASSHGAASTVSPARPGDFGSVRVTVSQPA